MEEKIDLERIYPVYTGSSIFLIYKDKLTIFNPIYRHDIKLNYDGYGLHIYISKEKIILNKRFEIEIIGMEEKNVFQFLNANLIIAFLNI